VRLQQVRIEGYRCLEDVTVGFGALTTLLGSNSTGKSSVLKALRFFFEGEALTIDDVFSQREDNYVSVQATFDNLSPADRDVFGVYALGEQMVLRRAWRDGSIKLTGRGLRYPGFEAVRALSGVPRRTAYKKLRADQPELDLPDVSRVDEADAEMLKWEMANPEQCTASDQDASHLFGYQSVGQRKLADRFKFVFVPGLQDAADEAVERKGSILERLLAAIADQRAEAREGLSALEDRFREEYTNLVEDTHRPTLDGLANSLGEQMRRYVPSAEIRLEPVAQQLAIAPPRVLLRGGEEHHLTDLGRQGHGFQRTFIIAALEYLAATQDIADGDRPTLFLGIEEPELYQHPPRAMHFAATLRELTSADGASVQVCYATHSPYFVTPSEFASIRICRRAEHPDGESASPTTITAADVSKVSGLLPDGDQKKVHRRLSSTLRASFRETFFARAVLLVEGETDIAVFTHAAHLLGIDLNSHGVVAAAVGKSVVPVAQAILMSLAIPTYVVFDGDHHQDAREPCEHCGRGGRDASNDANLNRAVLAIVGASAEDFPGTQHRQRWACFGVDLEYYLAEMVDDFNATVQAIAQALSWKSKSPEVYVELLERLGPDGLPEMLVEVPKAALALGEGAAG
jgi:putative ATP-dependent endonuclease of the OLD family